MQDEVKKMPRNTEKGWSMDQQDGVLRKTSNHMLILISARTFCSPSLNGLW